MKKQPLFLSLLLVLAVLIAACQPAYQWRGDPVDPPMAAPDFSLPDASGGTFNLKAQTGNVVLLYFGYTHCPDVCPTTLSDLKQTLTRLGDSAKRVRVVFITVDPARDTPEAMKQYTGRFEMGYVGLTAPQRALDPVMKAYGVTGVAQPDGTYIHTSSVFLIDPKGMMRVRFPYGLSVESMSKDIQYALTL